MTIKEVHEKLADNDLYHKHQEFINLFYSASREQQDFFLNNVAKERINILKAPDAMRAIINGYDPSGSVMLRAIRECNLPKLHLEPSNSHPYTFDLSSMPESYQLRKLCYDCAPDQVYSHVMNVPGSPPAHQGWNYHIKVNNVSDYARVVRALVPELQKMGVSFTLINPTSFLSPTLPQCDALIIPGSINFNFNKLSDEAKQILRESVDLKARNNEIDISGRVFARYGILNIIDSFRKEITSPLGEICKPLLCANRTPDWVSTNKNDIINFYEHALTRLEKSNDYRAFLQERETMCLCKDNNYIYATFVIRDDDIEKIKDIFDKRPDLNKLSFLTSHQVPTESGTRTEHLLMMHKNDLERCIDIGILNKDDFEHDIFMICDCCDVQLNRPDWDVDIHQFIVPNNSVDALKNCTTTWIPDNMFSVSVTDIAVLSCDCALIDKTMDVLEKLQIPAITFNEKDAIDLQSFINEKYNNGEFGFYNSDIVDEIDIDSPEL